MEDNDKFEYEERYDKAYDALVKYLAIAPRSQKECKDKLYEKGFHKNEVEYAIEKAKGYRYIDDAEYVRTFIAFNKSRYGTKKIAYKLSVEKGVDKNLVDNLIADNISDEYETDIASSVAQKYARQKKIYDKSGAQKVAAYLYQKGFSWNVINRVMSNLFDVFDEE